ncbi:MAG: exodeoxyribonuclease III [Acidimicrobiales bacterium]
MRIATWNVNSLNARLGRVEEWLDYARPDVLCMQETKLADAAFPYLAFEARGYEAAHNGQGRWNGVAILSRVGIDEVVPGMPRSEASDPDEARILTATCGGVRVSSVYVPNGRSLTDDHYRYKLRWLADLRSFLQATMSPGTPTVVAGDFNIAPADNDVASGIRADTHTSPEVRGALADLLDWGMVDVFRQHHPTEPIYSWWDYRAGDFHKGRGLRIDLLLASPPVAERTSFVLIDRQARKGKLPSDHAPVLLDADLD